MLNVTKLQFYETIWKQRKAHILVPHDFLHTERSSSASTVLLVPEKLVSFV